MIDKVIDKLVRIKISDDREYLGKSNLINNSNLTSKLMAILLGKLMCVDKTKAVFLQDALEIINREDKANYFDHDLFTPHLLRFTNWKDQRFILKYVGNVAIPGKHVKTIKLDKDMQAVYEEKEAEIL